MSSRERLNKLNRVVYRVGDSLAAQEEDQQQERLEGELATREYTSSSDVSCFPTGRAVPDEGVLGLLG